jgi:GNAT superfamily N-acetyltransferase
VTEWHRDGYTITTDRARVDLAVVHGFLAGCYWAEGIPLEVVRRAIEHSLNFSLYHGAEQVGFARVITDYATFAYLGDVFVLESHRGRGLAKWLMETVARHPELQGFRRWVLLTRDAHRFYEQIGFRPPASPGRYMEKWDPEVYRRGRPA